MNQQTQDIYCVWLLLTFRFNKKKKIIIILLLSSYQHTLTFDRTNVPKEVMSLPDYPFEAEDLLSSASHEIIQQYLYNYSVAFGVYPIIKVLLL